MNKKWRSYVLIQKKKITEVEVRFEMEEMEAIEMEEFDSNFIRRKFWNWFEFQTDHEK